MRKAACIGGMLSVMDGECPPDPHHMGVERDIDLERAQAAKKKAEERLAQSGISERELKLAEAKLHRALVRIGTAGKQE